MGGIELPNKLMGVEIPGALMGIKLFDEFMGLKGVVRLREIFFYMIIDEFAPIIYLTFYV